MLKCTSVFLIGWCNNKWSRKCFHIGGGGVGGGVGNSYLMWIIREEAGGTKFN